MFEFIKAVSDTVFDTINGIYHVKYSGLKTLAFIKAASDILFNNINAVYHDKS